MKTEAEAIAPSNIAIVKYWGKRNRELNLPLNPSLSISLNEVWVRSRVIFDESLRDDEVWINNLKLEHREVKDYAGRVLEVFRSMVGRRIFAKVESMTNFPSSAGLASSAAGIASITLASNEALGLNLNTKELSKIARIGSGSACRSLFGGFVKWNAGVLDSGEDSFCEEIVPSNHWPELVDVIAIFSEEKKKVSSRTGMESSALSSSLMKCRLDFIQRTFEEVVDAIRKKDQERFFNLTMRHSNSMHAVILDSWPPFFYLNDKSLQVMRWVYEYGKAAYTFDAGPNPHILVLENNASDVVNFLQDLGAKKVIVSKISDGPRVLK
ncbi:diphosphomevalonate decarboxylase [Metallosphaera tengchongensis]|uniref:Diphosphomevalonate decarboxylase n=1 Tax=Metallosphaera tengchongensis TaxID=1532350 RepID=A0A6N0NQU9_9CREN|nr:diphosphomevalonate decarboxylase [Metallosphaera tengchongensis]QKQ99243.1 diphosphomevalonate decarboxylase [Metallosphaera tengchongensis]